MGSRRVVLRTDGVFLLGFLGKSFRLTGSWLLKPREPISERGFLARKEWGLIMARSASVCDM